MEATDEGPELHEEIVTKSTNQVPINEWTFPEQSWPKELKAWAEADFEGEVIPRRSTPRDVVRQALL